MDSLSLKVMARIRLMSCIHSQIPCELDMTSTDNCILIEYSLVPIQKSLQQASLFYQAQQTCYQFSQYKGA